jgi:hypothetical protein
VVFAEQAFPGWRATVDGGTWREAASVDGFLATDVPAGADEVVFALGATPARRVGRGLSLLGWVVVLGLAARRRWA